MEAEKSIKITKYCKCRRCERSIQQDKVTRSGFHFVCIDTVSCSGYHKIRLAAEHKRINELDDKQFYYVHEDFL